MEWQNLAVYTYDETNRLVQGKNEQGEYSIYTYNGLGVRVGRERIMKDNTHGYTDFHDLIPSVETGIDKPEVVKESYVIDYTSATFDPLTMDEDGGFSYRWVYGLDKLSVKITSEGTNWWGQNVKQDILKDYCHQDRLGSTTNLTDKFGRVVGRADYNEWGEITYREALDITSSYRRIWPQSSYTGHDWDDVLGMYYAKARFYSAEDKRFVSMDPVKGNVTEPLSLVPYLYCVDNPLRWVDPLGLRLEHLDDLGGGGKAVSPKNGKNQAAEDQMKSLQAVPPKSSQNKTAGAPKPRENSTSLVPHADIPKMMRNNRSMREYNNKMSLGSSFNSTGNSPKNARPDIPNRIAKYAKIPTHYYPTFSCPESDSCFYDSLEDWATNFSNDAKSAAQAIWNNQGYWYERTRNANGVGDWIYSSANWFTLGSIEGFVEGTHRRWDAMLDKPGVYTVTNYFTLGIAETFHKAIFPQEHDVKVLSFEHVLNLGSAALIVYTAGKGYQQSHLDPHSVAGVAHEAFRPENVTMSQAAMAAMNQGGMTWDTYEDILARSIHNPSASQVMLGKYDGGGPTGYVAQAGSSYTYFSIDTWGAIEKQYGLTDAQMFSLFNEPFLEIQINAGKVFKFSHDPVGDLGALGREFNFLKKHGYVYDVATMTAYHP